MSYYCYAHNWDRRTAECPFCLDHQTKAEISFPDSAAKYASLCAQLAIAVRALERIADKAMQGPAGACAREALAEIRKLEAPEPGDAPPEDCL